MSGLVLDQASAEHQEPSVAVELLERLDPGVNRRRLGREHQARQAEVSPSEHSRADRGDDRGHPLDGLDPVAHGGPCDQEATAITMEPLPASP